MIRVSPDGDAHTVARWRNELVGTDQLGDPSLPPMLPAEAVPTTVAIGPDGWAYVGQLIGFPGKPGLGAHLARQPQRRGRRLLGRRHRTRTARSGSRASPRSSTSRSTRTTARSTSTRSPRTAGSPSRRASRPATSRRRSCSRSRATSSASSPAASSRSRAASRWARTARCSSPTACSPTAACSGSGATDRRSDPSTRDAASGPRPNGIPRGGGWDLKNAPPRAARTPAGAGRDPSPRSRS